jgi:hypothetical protein
LVAIAGLLIPSQKQPRRRRVHRSFSNEIMPTRKEPPLLRLV